MQILTVRLLTDRLTAAPATQAAKRFVRWWGDELLSLVPERWSRRWRPVATSEIRPGRDHVEIVRVIGGIGERLRNEHALDRQSDEDWAELMKLTEGTRNSVVLASEEKLILDLKLPRAALSRLSTAIRLQLDLHAPLQPEFIEWGYRLKGVSSDGLDVVVAIARRSRLDEFGNAFSERGLLLPPVVVDHEGALITVRPGKALVRSRESILDRRALYAALSMLLVSPLATLFVADAMAWWNGRRADELAIQLKPRIDAERRARNNDAIQIALVPITRMTSIAATLESMASSLPPTTYLVSLEQRPDHTLGFVVDGESADAVDEMLSSSDMLKDANIVDQAPKDQRVRVTYTATTR